MDGLSPIRCICSIPAAGSPIDGCSALLFHQWGHVASDFQHRTQPMRQTPGRLLALQVAAIHHSVPLLDLHTLPLGGTLSWSHGWMRAPLHPGLPRGPDNGCDLTQTKQTGWHPTPPLKIFTISAVSGHSHATPTVLRRNSVYRRRASETAQRASLREQICLRCCVTPDTRVRNDLTLQLLFPTTPSHPTHWRRNATAASLFASRYPTNRP